MNDRPTQTARLAPPSDADCDGTFYGCGNMLPEDRCGRCQNMSKNEPTTDTAAEWPKDGPEFNRWNQDAAAFARLIQDNPLLWLRDTRLKYLVLRIDTRDGAFVLSDRDGEPIEPERVMRAVAKSKEAFGGE